MNAVDRGNIGILSWCQGMPHLALLQLTTITLICILALSAHTRR